MLVYIEVLLANLDQFVSLPAGGIAGLREQWDDSPLSRAKFAVNPYVGWGAGEGPTQEEPQFLVGHAR